MVRRRGNHEGTITKRKDGLWQAAITVGGGRGGAKKKYAYARTRAEAAKKLIGLQGQVQNQTLTKGARRSLKDWTAEWLSMCKIRGLPESTLRDYEGAMRLYALPTLGHRKLDSLKPMDMQQLVDAMVAKGLRPQTVRDYLGRISACLSVAVDLEVMHRNPAAKVSLPELPDDRPVSLTRSEVKLLKSAAVASRLSALLTLSLATGLRQGEALGLRWGDIDLDKAKVSVHRTLKYTPVLGHYLKKPKTKASRRTLPLSIEAVTALKAHQDQQAGEVKRTPGFSNSNDLVFCDRAGGFIDAHNLVRRDFARWLEKAEVRRITWHSLRHTAATMMLGDPLVSIMTVSKMLGHRHASTTLNKYGHVLEEDLRSAADAMDAVMAG